MAKILYRMVSPPQAKTIPFGRTAGGLPTLQLWGIRGVPERHFAKAKPPPAEGEAIRPVKYKGAKDEISMASRQVLHQLTHRGPMVAKAVIQAWILQRNLHSATFNGCTVGVVANGKPAKKPWRFLTSSLGIKLDAKNV